MEYLELEISKTDTLSINTDRQSIIESLINDDLFKLYRQGSVDVFISTKDIPDIVNKIKQLDRMIKSLEEVVKEARKEKAGAEAELIFETYTSDKELLESASKQNVDNLKQILFENALNQKGYVDDDLKQIVLLIGEDITVDNLSIALQVLKKQKEKQQQEKQKRKKKQT